MSKEKSENLIELNNDIEQMETGDPQNDKLFNEQKKNTY